MHASAIHGTDNPRHTGFKTQKTVFQDYSEYGFLFFRMRIVQKSPSVHPRRCRRLTARAITPPCVPNNTDARYHSPQNKIMVGPEGMLAG